MDGGDDDFKPEYDEEHSSQISMSSDNEPDLDELQRKMNEIEEEQAKLKQIQSEVEGSMAVSGQAPGAFPPTLSPEEKAEADARSVYVGNVDYGCTAEELETHFHGCGSVSRVTILCDKFSGHPKGFAYVEFADLEGKGNAMAMNESLLRGRQIKVMEKRTNKPGISSTNRFPRSRGGRGVPRGGGYIVKYVPIYAGRRPRGGFRASMRRGRPF